MFGFLSKGDMKLALNKFSFSAGEEIEGKVKMQLKKPAKANGVYVTLVAEEKMSKMGMKNGSINSQTMVKKLIDVKIPLDGEKEYGTQPYEYVFKLKVPNINNQSAPEGALGDAAKAIGYLTQGSRTVNWFIEAKLDIPKGFDLGKKQAITVV
jgi:hypothetical protein